MKFLALASLLIAAAVAPAQQAAPKDVPTTHWAFKTVDDLFRAGSLHGYADGKFHGDAAVNNYELWIAVGSAQNTLKVLNLPGGQAATGDEMAQFKAAMAKTKASVDDLKSELANLNSIMGSLNGDMSRLKGGVEKLRKDLGKGS